MDIYRIYFKGWIDNINGPTGLLLALGTGSLTAIYGKENTRVDLVPADLVVNCIITAAFKYEHHKLYMKQPVIFLFLSCIEVLITIFL